MSNTTSKRQAIVHIGLEKTGTTSIQHSLDRNRDKLFEAGYFFPKSPGKINHTRLVAACLDVGVIDNIKANNLFEHKITEQELPLKFKNEFDAEINKNDNWSTLIISSELISSRLHSRSEVKRLIGLLQPYVDDICIVVFLRRQDRLALSRFSSAIRAGNTDFDSVFSDLSANAFFELPSERNENDLIEFYDHKKTLSRFENLGDSISLKVELYDPPDGKCNPLSVFYDLLGPHASALKQDPKTTRLNYAMSAEAQYIISELNKKYTVQHPTGMRNEGYRNLIKRIETEVSGQRRTVSALDAKLFFERFHESNEHVRTLYFPEQNSLFDEDFTEYPDSLDYEPMKRELDSLVRKYLAIASSSTNKGVLRSRLKRLIRTTLSGVKITQSK